ncbi:MAG: type IX secretion system sortase PorU [Dysgonomonas sp.]
MNKNRTSLNKFLISFITFLFFVFNVYSEAPNAGRYTKKSVLSEGNWFKIKVGETGVYKLTYEKLRSMGISDPKNVQVYGYGGWILDQDFTKPYTDDLPQVAVWMSKPREQFGPGDYILFYGKGNIKWTYNNANEFEQTQNPYSSDSYYFVTESNEGPLLMEEVPGGNLGSTVVTTFADYYLHEQELVNISETGREFFGENFRYTKTRDFNVPLPGLVIDPVDLPYVRFNFIALSKKRPKVELSVNKSKIIEAEIPAGGSSSYVKAMETNSFTTTNRLGENNIINITYAGGDSEDKNVHLNFFRINYKRALKPYGAVTLFRSKVRNSNLGFKISGASDKLLVFDVTNGENPKRIKANLTGSELSFAASNISIKEYAMVDFSKNIPEPAFVGKVANQNLHGLESKEMIIIVRPYLKKYAEELAQIHKDDSGLETIVVTAEDIYNEFSSGKPDATAYRRFVKMFYDRALIQKQAPQYLLLFGDGCYDNRFIYQDKWSSATKQSMLLTYQTSQSINESDSYVTDDYFGFLDDAKGMTESSMLYDVLDIAIGRLPVKSENEAKTVIQKIRYYLEDTEKGIWKNNIAFVADDLVSSSESDKFSGADSEKSHIRYSDNYARTINQKYPDIIVTKIYEDAFRRVITANGGKYPDAKKLLFDNLNSGLLFLNYVGHGSTRNWAHEDILTLNEIEKLNNRHYPVLITATCDFSRFDGDNNSGGEAFLLNPKGGAIALFTTVRVVYGGFNNDLNTALLNHIFEKVDGKSLRLGDIMRNAKNERNTKENGLKFFLLGDPALRVTAPDDTYKVKLTEVNSKSPNSSDIQFKALSTASIKGDIVGTDGNISADFNGKLEVEIFDSQQDLTSRANKRDGTSWGDELKLSYKDYTNKLYSGTVEVKNGSFQINFTVPKDILYSDNFGKMSFYAYSDSDNRQAQGSFLNYKVGGVDGGAVAENNPPQILKMYFNKEDFVSGDEVNATPLFYAKVSDDTGINVSSGIGHGMTVTIDGVTTYDITSSFTGNDPELKSGDVKYLIPQLSEGKHTLQFKVWDVWNNSASQDIDFEVVDNYKPVVYKFDIIGNPAVNETRFRFTSDVTGSNVMVKYEVYSITGVLHWSHEESGSVDMMSNYEYLWYLQGNSGNRLEPGIYICRMTVSVDGNAKASKSEKLVISGQ